MPTWFALPRPNAKSIEMKFILHDIACWLILLFGFYTEFQNDAYILSSKTPSKIMYQSIGKGESNH
jgi:hypothetical protein